MTTIVAPMSVQMATAVSRATDMLQLPTNGDFALYAMGLVLRSMGLVSKTGRPIGFSQTRHRQRREHLAKETRRRARL